MAVNLLQETQIACKLGGDWSVWTLFVSKDMVGRGTTWDEGIARVSIVDR